MATDREPLQREAIVAAGRGLVIDGGLEALSLRRLAGRLGVTAPALYAHVQSKQDLLRAIAEGEFERLVARFDAVTATDPIERIRAHGRAYVEHAREQPELFRVMFLFPPAMIPADVPDDDRLPGATQAFAAAAGAVEAAIETGALEVDDPLLLSLTLWSGVHGVASVLQLGVDLPPELEEAMIDDITDRILASYLPGAPRLRSRRAAAAASRPTPT